MTSPKRLMPLLVVLGVVACGVGLLLEILRPSTWLPDAFLTLAMLALVLLAFVHWKRKAGKNKP